MDHKSQELPSQILTVSQLTDAIKNQLETHFPSLHLQGEITNCKQQSSGHLYFSLKDSTTQIAAVMFKADVSLLKTLPKGGEQVIVKASLNVYPPRGSYQLIIRELAYAGIGELLQKLELLKIKLNREGWFRASRKKKLPFLPKTIGIVTSPTGAVIQDILHILSRRFPNFHVILNPVKVQGEGAADEIAGAIDFFNACSSVDLIIICRGGGSLEDLWAFNEEKVAMAIFNSHIPTISAVGHETDHCIADYVADLRAPTPSAAAELALPEKKSLLNQLTTLKKRLQQSLDQIIIKNRHRLEKITHHPLMKSPYAFIQLRSQHIDEKEEHLKRTLERLMMQKTHLINLKKYELAIFNPSRQLLAFRQKLENLKAAFYQSATWRLKEKRERFLHVTAFLSAVNPKKVLQQGYSILFSENKQSVINSVMMIKEGEKAKVLLSDGQLLVTINKINCDQ